MRAAHLRRIDARGNNPRYDALNVQPTLLGEWSLMRELILWYTHRHFLDGLRTRPQSPGARQRATLRMWPSIALNAKVQRQPQRRLQLRTQ